MYRVYKLMMGQKELWYNPKTRVFDHVSQYQITDDYLIADLSEAEKIRDEENRWQSDNTRWGDAHYCYIQTVK